MAVFCRKCGTEVPEGQGACPRCGSQNLIVPGNPQSSTGGPMVTQAPTPPPGGSGGGPVLTSPRPAAGSRSAPRSSGGGQTSGLAIASLILSLLGVGLVGLILGIVALSQINKSNGEIGGKGLAISGIILAVLGPMVLAAILFPAFNMGKQFAYTNICLNNQNQIALALQMYVEDHNGQYPPANSDWAEALADYVGGSDKGGPSIFNCLASPHAGSASEPDYGVNANILGQPMNTIANPAQALLLADSSSSAYLLKSVSDIDMTRHTWKDEKSNKRLTGVAISYADGHADVLTASSTVNLTVERRVPVMETSPFGGSPYAPSSQPMMPPP